MADELNVSYWIRRMLQMELQRPDIQKFLSDEDLNELLNDEEDTRDGKVRSSIFGYPSRPLYKDLSQRLTAWIDTKKCPMDLLPKHDMLDEQDYIFKRSEMVDLLATKVGRIPSLFSHWSKDEKMFCFREIFVILGKRGLMDMLGLRKTIGSVDMWPPARRKLEESFCKKCSPETSSVLSVGARALSKHAHRDVSSSWWGVSTGSESNKNHLAFKKLTEILDNATWLNIHGLPNNVNAVEAREENGYGLRWTCEDGEFRGFLEPQMEGGHEVGWSH